MPPVFGQDTPNPHPYDNPLAEWLGFVDSSWRSMARNVMHDHRVSEARAASFDRYVDHPCTSSGLNRGVVNYFKKEIRNETLPHYLNRAVNENNFLTGRGLLPMIHKDVRLVRVLDLNGLRFVIQWGNEPAHRKREWETALLNFPTSLTDHDVTNWLNGELRGKSSSQIAAFVETILDIVNSYAHGEPYQPIWATALAAFEPYLDKEPDRWLQLLGIPSLPPRWLILLSYSVAEAGILVRPTTLDAAWNGYHFPSPPQASVASGGHPMDLRIDPEATTLLPEYIHKQIPHKLAHWTELGGKIGRTSAPDSTALTDQRAAHLELLAEAPAYGPDVLRWMPAAV
jgi:hypothetical protein